MDRQIYPSYAKIRLTRSEINGFGTIVREILSEICEDPTYANPTYAWFTVYLAWRDCTNLVWSRFGARRGTPLMKRFHTISDCSMCVYLWPIRPTSSQSIAPARKHLPDKQLLVRVDSTRGWDDGDEE